LHIYIIRHGQSLANIGKQITPNCGLSTLGEEQSQSLIKFFESIKIDVIYSSPLKRTIQTATPLAKSKLLPILLVPEMCEIFNEEWIDHRDYEWESCKQITSEYSRVQFIEAHNTTNKWWPDWPETTERVMERVNHFYNTELERYIGTDKKIVVFGHGHTTGDLKKIVCPSNDSSTPNAGVFEYEIDSTGYCKRSQIGLDHLGEKVTH
jgi:broad specificity phosphatase PhoE